MRYSDIINKVSQDTGIKPEIIDKTYKAYWSFIRTSIQKLPLKDNISDEEFLRLRPNFNIPSLGKLVCTIDRFRRVKENFGYIKKIRKRYEETD